MRYDIVCHCGWRGEVEKSMQAEYPLCPVCGSRTGRIWDIPVVHYAAPGFTATDNRFAKMIGPERNARFEAQKADVLTRAREGRLTPYEKSLERPHALEG